MGGITNIDQKGFSSAAFHSWPDMMAWDAYSGDYGMGFFGHAYAAATYVVHDPVFGWLGFGGTIQNHGGTIRIAPRDGARSRLFIAPAGQWITLQAGKIAQASYAPATGEIGLTLDPATPTAPVARVFVESTITDAGPRTVDGAIMERGGFTVQLGPKPRTLTLHAP